jgi:hypothetical protein
LALEAFDAPAGLRLGEVGVDDVRLAAVPRRRLALDLDAVPDDLPRVDVVPLPAAWCWRPSAPAT